MNKSLFISVLLLMILNVMSCVSNSKGYEKITREDYIEKLWISEEEKSLYNNNYNHKVTSEILAEGGYSEYSTQSYLEDKGYTFSSSAAGFTDGIYLNENQYYNRTNGVDIRALISLTDEYIIIHDSNSDIYANAFKYVFYSPFTKMHILNYDLSKVVKVRVKGFVVEHGIINDTLFMKIEDDHRSYHYGRIAIKKNS